MKKCTSCQIDKEPTEYQNCKITHDKLNRVCKKCRAVIQKRYRERHKSKSKEYSKKYRAENKEKEKIRHKKYRAENKDRLLIYEKDYRNNNKEKIKKAQSKYYQENKEKVARKSREYGQKNRGKVNARTAKRHASKLKRTPKWANLNVIACFYDNCPEGHEVDHIYPLNGKKCSGFHVLSNLQYLTIRENRQKWNKTPEDWEKEKNTEEYKIKERINEKISNNSEIWTI